MIDMIRYILCLILLGNTSLVSTGFLDLSFVMTNYTFVDIPDWNWKGVQPEPSKVVYINIESLDRPQWTPSDFLSSHFTTQETIDLP